MLKVTPHHGLPNRIKFCSNCKHVCVRMTPQKNEIKCKLFYTLDLVNGDTFHESAYNVRKNEDKCGIDAKFFEGLTQSDNIA